MKNLLLTCLLGASISACATGGHREAKVESEPLDEKASVHYDFAFDAYNNGELIPALREALKAEELAPKNASVQNLLGLILFRQSKFDEAEAAFNKAGQLDPKMSEAFNNLGSLYLAQKKFEAARVALIQAEDNPLYLYPERIQNNLGLAYWGLNQLNEAETAFRTSIQYQKDFYLPRLNLGRLLLERGTLAEAQENLEEAAKLCSECAEPQFFLGQTAKKLNRLEAAKSFFKKGFSLDPKGAIGKACKEQLLTVN